MVPFQNPSIELFGLRIDEPVTALTDILVATVGIIGFYKINSKGNKSVFLYRYFILFIALSTLVAGFFGHAFAYNFGTQAKVPGWIIGILGVALAQFAAVINTKNYFSKANHNLLLVVCSLEVFVTCISLAFYQSFVVVQIHAAFGLVVMVTLLEYINYSKSKSHLSKGMLIGVGLAVIAIVSQGAKLAISEWFNHMDLGHIFMALALLVMYKGILKENKLSEV